MTEDILKSVVRRYSVFGEDFAQEARIAEWQARQKSSNIRYIRQRMSAAIIDALRSVYKTRCSTKLEFLPLDEENAPGTEPTAPREDVDMCADLALIRACVLTSQLEVARAFGVSAPVMCKMVGKAKARLAKKHGVKKCPNTPVQSSS